MAMRDQIYEAIQAGGATKESLLDLTGTTDKGLASQFTYLRMMGKCPMRQEDGTFKIVSTDEWEAHRASSASAPSIALTPAERVDKAQKREKRASTAYDNAKKRAEANSEDQLAQLQMNKAEIELQISSILLSQAEEALTTQGEGAGDPQDVGDDVETDDIEEEEYEEDDLE